MNLDQTSYSINDPVKIQGRDEVLVEQRSLAALRLSYALDALPGPGNWILMPGAGAGRYARAFARHFPQSTITAGDLSSLAVKEAKELGGGPEYQVFDVSSMPFASASYDSVVFFDLLEHVPSPQTVLSECFRVLRPGGVLHFFVPLEAQPSTLYRLLQDDRWIPIHHWKQEHVGHIQRFTSTEVLKLCWSAGFLVTDLKFSFHMAGQVHDIVDYWHRERSRDTSSGKLPLPAVRAVSRLIMMATWRLAYLEDRMYRGSALASGLHVTATKPSTS